MDMRHNTRRGMQNLWQTTGQACAHRYLPVATCAITEMEPQGVLLIPFCRDAARIRAKRHLRLQVPVPIAAMPDLKPAGRMRSISCLGSAVWTDTPAAIGHVTAALGA